MKKITLLFIALSFPLFVFADFGAPWIGTSTPQGTIFPAKVNLVYPNIQIPWLTATSATATSTFNGQVKIVGNLQTGTTNGLTVDTAGNANISNTLSIGDAGGGNTNLGSHCLVVGNNNTVANSATDCTVLGYTNTHAGSRGLIAGYSNIAGLVSNPIILGSSNTINDGASDSGIFGFGNEVLTDQYDNFILGTATILGAGGATGVISIGDSNRTSGNIGAGYMWGTYLSVGGDTSMVLGRGVNLANPLIDNVANTMYFGFNSDIPTLVIGNAGGIGRIGNVGIGTTSPYAMLSVTGTGVFSALRSTTTLSCSGSNALNTDATGLIICGATSGGGGGTYPFTPTLLSGIVYSATTSPLLFPQEIVASSSIGNLTTGVITSTSTATSTFTGGVKIIGGGLTIVSTGVSVHPGLAVIDASGNLGRFNDTVCGSGGVSRGVTSNGSANCGAVQIADLASSAMSFGSSDSSLTVTATCSLGGSTCDFKINLAHANTWTATQTFANLTAVNATTTGTLYSNQGYFASSTMGNIVVGSLTATSSFSVANFNPTNITATNATTTAFFSTLGRIVDSFFASSSIGKLTVGSFSATSTAATSTVVNLSVTGNLQVNKIIETTCNNAPCVGDLKWQMTSTPGVVAPGSDWHVCDGSTVSDSASPINGQTLNGSNVSNYFTRSNSTSGDTGGAASHSHGGIGTWLGTAAAGSDYPVPTSDPFTDSQPNIPPYQDAVCYEKIK